MLCPFQQQHTGFRAPFADEKLNFSVALIEIGRTDNVCDSEESLDEKSKQAISIFSGLYKENINQQILIPIYSNSVNQRLRRERVID